MRIDRLIDEELEMLSCAAKVIRNKKQNAEERLKK
jgi:hypothetical protein